MVWLLVLLSVGWSRVGDEDYIDPQASAREILEGLDVDPGILEIILEDVRPAIKTLSRSTWMFHRQSHHLGPIPRTGRLPINHPVHREFFEMRMNDFSRNAEYGRRSYEGSGLYLAPTPSSFDGSDYYMLGVQIPKGARFIDFRIGQYLSEGTKKALKKVGCHNQYFTLQTYGRCRAINVAFARAAKLQFLLYTYGVGAPRSCDHNFAFVMLDPNVSQVLGWTPNRYSVPKDLLILNGQIAYYSQDFGGAYREKAGAFGRKNFMGCGEYPEDLLTTKGDLEIELDLDYPKEPEKVASCEPPGEIDRLASVVKEVVRF